MTTPFPAPIAPGLLVLHGNRLELLRDALVDWIDRTPLAPLEEEFFLVQSNGAAEWLKMSLARARGVCMAARVELPARFLWRAYRAMLGPQAVPVQSPLDREALAWRLMRLLPGLAAQPAFEPVARFLGAGAARRDGVDEIERRWQLAQRLADLFDQYQVYRADWLADWARGDDRLRGVPAAPLSAARDVPDDQRWQPALWRVLLSELDEPARAAIRPEVHRRFVDRLHAGDAPHSALPRRVVLFGASHLPAQVIEALDALGRRSQVIAAVPDPCRFHWADIVEGRELLRPLPAPARRASRGNRSLADVAPDAMHAHAHPLLAAWGRQGRDFMRELDAFDAQAAARGRPELPRVDVFDEDEGDTLLRQLQSDIRDLVPPGERAPRPVAADDRSILFHVAHSAQREVEVLHDRLLSLLADPPEGRPLAPRDIAVMVPDIEAFAPAIRAVFGQVPRHDRRYIPFEIADLRQRGSNPLVVAVEWLLRAPAQRFRASEVRDLLEVPGIARRFGLGEDDLGPLAAWITGAGVRWGLDEDQREGLGLRACGDANTWAFGLRRMLLGFAMGDLGASDESAGEAPPAWHGIEPYAEIGGLDAARVGALDDLLRVLEGWWRGARDRARPSEWAARARALLESLVQPVDERERLTVAALRQGLADWLAQCDQAGFDEPVPLPVLREAWLAAVDTPTGGGRFLAGGVTFCTLMPLRAVPFEVVALLGMDDGAFPRPATRGDFDLMGLPGVQRPGDRARRDDDRYLLLEALLSARRTLIVSWAGRSVRDNSLQPPSVLVAQLRDHLASQWRAEGVEGEGAGAGAAMLAARTFEHPLQPFSRRYFEGGALATQAREWRAAHAQDADRDASSPLAASALPVPDDATLDLDRLGRFLKHPVREFFRVQLDADLRLPEAEDTDDEPFELAGLTLFKLVESLVAEAAGAPGDLDEDDAGEGVAVAPEDDPWAGTLFAAPPRRPGVRERVERRLQALQREGALPMAALGEREKKGLERTAVPMARALRAARARWPEAVAPLPLQVVDEDSGAVLADWLDGLRAAPGGEARPVWFDVTASKVLVGGLPRPGARKAPALIPGKLVKAWVRLLAASAQGTPVRGVLVAREATLHLGPPDPDEARAALHALLRTWREGMASPLPAPMRTALAWLKDPASDKARLAYEGDPYNAGEVDDDPHLQRVFPDWESLASDGRFEFAASRLHAPFARWLAGQGEGVVVHPDAVDDGDEDEEGRDG